jgi:hypothetical protein
MGWEEQPWRTYTLEQALERAAAPRRTREQADMLDRLDPFKDSLSPEGRRVFDLLRRCGTGHVQSGWVEGYRIERSWCRHPMCMRCGAEQADRISRENSSLIRAAQEQFGPDSISFVSVEADVCEVDDLTRVISRLRKRFRNTITRKLDPKCSLYFQGEMDVSVKFNLFDVGERTTVPPRPHQRETDSLIASCGRSRKAKNASPRLTRVEHESTPPVLYNSCAGGLWDRVMVLPHVHGVLIHPEVTRERVRQVLREPFTDTLDLKFHAAGVAASRRRAPVRVEPITDRNGRFGEPIDGAGRVGRYIADRAGAVKGMARAGDPREQAMAFDAFARAMGGTRRRMTFRIGRLAVATTVSVTASPRHPSIIERMRARSAMHRVERPGDAPLERSSIITRMRARRADRGSIISRMRARRVEVSAKPSGKNLPGPPLVGDAIPSLCSAPLGPRVANR